MNKLIVSLLVGWGLSSSAGACPNLTGNYICNFGGGHELMPITQNEENGVTTYTFANDHMVADGGSHQFPGSAPVEQAMYRASCVADQLIVDINRLMIDRQNGNKKYGSMETRIEFGLTPTGDLDHRVTGKMIYDGVRTDPFNEATVCIRQ